MESMKANYEDEKQHISSQLRSVQDQESIIKEVVYRKEEEIKRMDEELRKIIDHKNYLEANLREMAENDQKKTMRIH